MPLSPRLSLLASTSIVSPWLLSFWIIHYFINLLNSLISMRDGCSQPPETIPISQDLLFLSCDKSTIHSSDVDLWWYWLPLWGSTSNRSFQLWEEDTRDWLNSVQNFIIITIPEHSGSWTRGWCNQSLCSLQYTCRGTIEYSYQISSIVSGSRGVNEYSLWLHSSAGPRSAAICTPRNLKLLRLSTTVLSMIVNTRISPPEVNNPLFSLANVVSKSVVLAPFIQIIDLPPLLGLIITQYSANNCGIVSKFKRWQWSYVLLQSCV